MAFQDLYYPTGDILAQRNICKVLFFFFCKSLEVPKPEWKCLQQLLIYGEMPGWKWMQSKGNRKKYDSETHTVVQYWVSAAGPLSCHSEKLVIQSQWWGDVFENNGTWLQNTLQQCLPSTDAAYRSCCIWTVKPSWSSIPGYPFFCILLHFFTYILSVSLI